MGNFCHRICEDSTWPTCPQIINPIRKLCNTITFINVCGDYATSSKSPNMVVLVLMRGAHVGKNWRPTYQIMLPTFSFYVFSCNLCSRQRRWPCDPGVPAAAQSSADPYRYIHPSGLLRAKLASRKYVWFTSAFGQFPLKPMSTEAAEMVRCSGRCPSRPRFTITARPTDSHLIAPRGARGL
ncbi:hypothetical protein PGT21_003855 [Puccinia graminis f. sp. tritici]|uniref:Uncharacterized protein n=2 Tax=Puccinia graminis f. sp. tritici TaxID=56615 RepID=E3JZA0_PUCGT|nr:uncharacterized protein PGTG_03331 [Puccinia graminis f. sp. tritici CRL 75-36-700-3]EFP77375.1 hypothetical protein PGTG_03331 [Puccinia graminis f. sp. tritici CRL 75-36-700-3]KAA1114312.1 hypothetical protein PGT21_003855 [Puccinia graminis f. sp. tritici]